MVFASVREVLDALSRETGRDIRLFSCQRCGDCCRQLGGHVSLLPREVGLFPASAVRPLYGIKRGHSLKIVMYELAIETCPHLGEGSTCGIYRRRPAVCRSYPLTYVPPGLVAMSPDCPQRLSFPTREMTGALRSYLQGMLFFDHQRERIVGFYRGEWLPAEEHSRRTLLERGLGRAAPDGDPGSGRRVTAAIDLGPSLPPVYFFVPNAYLQDTV